MMAKNPDQATRDAARKRQKRLQEGEAQLAAEQAVTLPSQGQLMLPLLRCLDAMGGRAAPADLYDAIAQEIGVAPEVREASATWSNGRTSNLFERQVRHAYQLGKLKGVVEAQRRAEWSMTERGYGALENARPGVVLTIFETSAGLAIWGHVEEVAALIEPGSVSTIWTSSPYPILDARPYGGVSTASWISWHLDLMDLWKVLLKPGGSIFLNMSADIYRRGVPFQSTYLERFVTMVEDRCGYQLAQRWWWDNPAKLANLEWSGKRRLRLRQSVEPIYWWVNTAGGIWDSSDNSRILEPYAPATRQKYLDQVKEAAIRPSGIDIGGKSFSKDNGGKIPSTLQRISNSASNSPYHRACKAAGLPAHPAISPAGLAERAILMTTEPGEIIYEPFGGSLQIPAVAERLGRRWIASDRSRVYLKGGALRFPGAIMVNA